MQALRTTVGQQLAIHFGTGWQHAQLNWTVKHVTPTGQFVAVRDGDNLERRFDKFGEPMWDKWSKGRVRTDIAVVIAEQAKYRALRQAEEAVNAVFKMSPVRNTYGADYMIEQLDKMQALIDTARAVVQAVK